MQYQNFSLLQIGDTKKDNQFFYKVCVSHKADSDICKIDVILRHIGPNS